MAELFLVLNCGSSSIKYAVLDLAGQRTMHKGIVENINQAAGKHSWSSDAGAGQQCLAHTDYPQAIQAIKHLLGQNLGQQLKGVGHRVVHGGEVFKQSVVITPQALVELQACSHLAPLHHPANLAGIYAMQQLYPELPQVAVFDTAFHQTLDKTAYLYALPYEYYTKYAVRRYGFHGISYSYVTQQALVCLGLDLTDSALLIAHLGNGCSATAVLNGQSVDTTMGMTPLEGLVMGTRCGDIDPSIPIFLAQQAKLNLDQVYDLLNKQSGLLGISGLSHDMRTLANAAAEGHERAQLAIDIFCYKLAKYLAALAVSLGRIDGLVFTGGIGENSAPIRAKVLDWLKLLGFRLDPVKNSQHGKTSRGFISTENSVPALVIATDEELMIAQETANLLSFLPKT